MLHWYVIQCSLHSFTHDLLHDVYNRNSLRDIDSDDDKQKNPRSSILQHVIVSLHVRGSVTMF